jgi:DNA-directed RNA polymerase III subunit RPC2
MEGVSDLRAKHRLIQSFLEMKGLAQQHIDSFNELLDFRLRAIVMAKTNNRVLCEDHPDFQLQYESVRVGLPTHPSNYDRLLRESVLYPFEARASDLTYAADIFVNIRYSYHGYEERRENVRIGRLPVMLGSAACRLKGMDRLQLARVHECPFDPLGYFVINGTEKVILVQEQLIENRVIVEKNTKLDAVIAGVVSYTVDTKSVCCLILKHGKIYFKSSSFAKLVPVFVLFKALGVETEQEVFGLVGADPATTEALVLSLEEGTQVHCQDEALHFLSQQLSATKYGPRTRSGMAEVRLILANILLAHIPCKNHQLLAKARYLAYMVRRLIEGYHHPDRLDNRDYYGNKRMKCAGQLLELLFEDNFKRLNSELKESLKKALNKKAGRPPEIKYLIESRSGLITKGFEQAIATGNWVIKRFNMERKGVSQLLSRISYISSLGMMMRVNSQFEKTRKIAGPRALLGSHWGIICPCDTPDGEGCGIIKNLSLCCNISTSTTIPAFLPILPFELCPPEATTVMNNGLPLGGTTRPGELAAWVRGLRRRGLVDIGVNISHSQGLVHINSDSGRLVRPLIVVQQGRPLVTGQHIERLEQGGSFRELLKEGVVEYLDVNEQDNALIALREADLTPESTHLEIDPLTILGCVAGIIPFPNHNQSPRNTYQCSMGKQALGVTGLNEHVRFDTLNFFLVYTQKPMVKTFTIDLINYNELPAGHNASVAIMSYSGYDIEDAIVMNRAALDRGFGRTLYFRRYETVFKRYTDEIREVLGAPEKKPKHRHLEQDGLARIGASLSTGDVFANKMVPVLPPESLTQGNLLLLKGDQVEWMEEPSSYKGFRPSVVDKVLITAN